MYFWLWLEGALNAVVIGSALGGIVVYILKTRDDRIRKRESDARALAFYRKHYEERMDGETHLLSMDGREKGDKNWLVLDPIDRVRGNATDFFSTEELREKVAVMPCPLRTLVEYHSLFRRECRFDGKDGQEEYRCTSLDGGNSWFYVNGDGVYKGTLAELPQFKLRQLCIEGMCARAEKREKIKSVNRILALLGFRTIEGENTPIFTGEDMKALGNLGIEVKAKVE